MTFREGSGEHQLDPCLFDDFERQVEILTPAVKHTAVEFRIKGHDPLVLVLDQKRSTRRAWEMGHVDSATHNRPRMEDGCVDFRMNGQAILELLVVEAFRSVLDSTRKAVKASRSRHPLLRDSDSTNASTWIFTPSRREDGVLQITLIPDREIFERHPLRVPVLLELLSFIDPV
jgi:hypothetical protein